MPSESTFRGAKWLLLFNCQAEGLANCLECLSPGLRVERFDAGSLQKQWADISGRLPEFEHIVIAPRVKDLVGQEVARHDRVTWIPHVWFQGYHPDLCYLAGNGPLAAGAVGAYHSVIAFAAFSSGLTVEQTLALYREDVYASLGYFEFWEPARARMLGEFDLHGFDLRRELAAWARSGVFMHSINHPRIGVLMDIARQLLRRLGREPVESGIIPHDNLANGPAFPVYPEVGSRLGAVGSYNFKKGGTYRVMPLEQLVTESFNLYRSIGDVKPANPAFFTIIDRAKTLVRQVRQPPVPAAGVE